METLNVILCGLGGQGILFMTRILAHTALAGGCDVIGAETHGMAQRGGSVVSHVRIGKAQSSLVPSGSAHLLLALEENECYRSLPFLAPGSRIFVNAEENRFPVAEVKDFLSAGRIQAHAFSATRLALEMDAPRSSNLAMIGFFAAFAETPLAAERLRKVVGQLSPPRFKDLNLSVFDAARQRARPDRQAG
jgi:indolepyruvate ferredoxin oxidoreductase beta subunit